jgi:hypothetical protein
VKIAVAWVLFDLRFGDQASEWREHHSPANTPTTAANHSRGGEAMNASSKGNDASMTKSPAIPSQQTRWRRAQNEAGKYRSAIQTMSSVRATSSETLGSETRRTHDLPGVQLSG